MTVNSSMSFNDVFLRHNGNTSVLGVSRTEAFLFSLCGGLSRFIKMSKKGPKRMFWNVQEHTLEHT